MKETWIFATLGAAELARETLAMRMPSNHYSWVNCTRLELDNPPEQVRTWLRSLKAKRIDQ